jgi:hypothetical protein
LEFLFAVREGAVGFVLAEPVLVVLAQHRFEVAPRSLLCFEHGWVYYVRSCGDWVVRLTEFVFTVRELATRAQLTNFV